MALTEKQEKFCRNIVSGLNGKESYVSAYNTQGSDQNAYNEASKLLAREDIQERIKALRKPLEVAAVTQALSERDRVKAMLWSFIDNDTLSPETRMKASDQLNKLNAEYINVNRNIDEKRVDINNLDLDTLKKLSEGL